MNTADFMAQLHRLDVEVWADGNRLLYNAPVEALTPAVRTELKKRKAEILMFLHQAGEVGETKHPPLEPAPREGLLRLSFAQERLWFLHQLEPDSLFYNIPVAWRLKGVLHQALLQQSLDALVVRHEILRTTFPTVNGRPVQVIGTAIDTRIPVEDFRFIPAPKREEAVEQYLRKKQQEPFDLASGPLFRAKLLRLAEDEHVFFLTMHHIVSDGWSIGIFTRELAALYQAFCNGDSSPLPDLPIQYTDFAHWQRRWLKGEVLDNQLSYWRQQLKGITVLQIPTDRPRPAVQTFQGATRKVKLPLRLCKSLRSLSRQERATLFMTLLAAFQTLLYRYTGQDDIVVGSPIANRNRAEIEGLIGFFVNSLAMRSDLSGNPSFRELLGRVREVALGAYAHQDLPFEKLVEDLQPERDMSRSPLFQIMFAFQNAPMEALELPGLTLTPYGMDSLTVRFDMEFHLWEKPDGLHCAMVYNTNLFDAPTITRMLGHYRTLLEGIVANPEQRISELSLLTEAERQQLLVEWNDTRTDYPKNSCIHELFEAQVERNPDAIAVMFGNQQLSYRELNVQSNQLAHYLKKRGVGPEVMVGICLERSVEMVVGLLGILKAGGAYVPLDPEYPQERLAFMLEDTKTPLLLTQASLKEHLPKYSGRVVCLDSDWRKLEGNSTSNLNPGLTARNLAYVMYTSGSTGRPKGTCIEHRSVIRLIKETNYVKLGPQEVFLQFAPISFDASTFELWGSLLNGTKLVVFPMHRPSLKDLGEFIQKEGITTLWLTAALFHQMMDGQLESLTYVRQILAGGEALSVPHVQKMIERLGDHRLINGYGPTENTTFTACHVMTAESCIGRSVPIGAPISNTQVYILDRQMRPVPVGVYGELYIGGDGLAREYLNRPALTAERFIPNPFSYEPGARLYRTGDLVRYRVDGNIEFLGRTDNQVKIRGYRIELGEIETVLGQHPRVREVVVLCREARPKDKALVAYIVAADEMFSAGDLRDFLREKLPEYMLPSFMVAINSLPLTPNGKVDHKALPSPENMVELEKMRVLPTTSKECEIAAIWQEILQIDKIGIHDNFFDLGGHSLLVMKLHSRLLAAFSHELAVIELFEFPTVHTQAKLISRHESAGSNFQTVRERAARQRISIKRRMRPTRKFTS
jgi:aspartate racemase